MRFQTIIKDGAARFIEALKKETGGDIKKLDKEKIEALPPVEFDFEKLLALTESTIEGAMLFGFYHASEKSKNNKRNFADDELSIGGSFDMPFEDAVQFLKSKIPMTKEDWKHLKTEGMTEAEYQDLKKKLQFRAFTVAALSEPDYTEAVKGVLLDALQNGKTMMETWADIEAMTNDWGESFVPNYWETVYRTNVQSAYNAGTLMEYRNNEPPAWELLFVEDERQSDTCRSLAGMVSGKALLRNNPFWSVYGYPPYHFNCRTTLRAVYADELGSDIEVANAAMKKIRKNFKVQDGFGGNPLEKESWWKITPVMIERADKYGITADIVAQARKLDMQSYFPELLKGYETIHAGKKGGYVQMALNAAQQDFEINDAKRLADLGHRIYLLPNTYQSKSPDMIIDNEIGEMKSFGFDGKIPTKNTIKSEIKDAGSKQRGRIIYIHIADEVEPEVVLDAVTSEIGRTPIKKVFLEHRGVINEYTRQFFFHRRKQKGVYRVS